MKDLKIFRQHFSDVYVSKCEIMLKDIEGRDNIIADNRVAYVYIVRRFLSTKSATILVNLWKMKCIMNLWNLRWIIHGIG